MIKQNVWGIHMRDIDGSLPIDDGFIAIGWADMGNLNHISKTRAAFKKHLEATYPDEKQGAIPVKAGVLFRFVHEMQEGDVIIFPSKVDRTVNIGIVTGSYQYKEEPDHEYHHVRTVDWKAHIPRDEFPQAALNEIGSAITLFSVGNNTDEFLKRLEQPAAPAIQKAAPAKSQNEETIDDEAITSATTQKAAETTADFIIRRLKNHLSDYEFEKFVAHLMECMGYQARVTRRSGDGGVDVIAHRDELGFEPPIIKVQCKQITTKSSGPDVTQLLGTLGEGEFALFVNLGSYSTPAQEREKNRAKLRLIGGSELVELIMENYHKLAPRYRTLLPLKQIYVADV